MITTGDRRRDGDDTRGVADVDTSTAGRATGSRKRTAAVADGGTDDAGTDDAGTDDAGADDRVPGAVREAVDDETIDAVEERVPDWDDDYLDRVSGRLMFNYDLSKDHRVRGETWDLFGKMRIENQKQFFHRSINFANHHVEEYLFARRVPGVRTADLDRLVDLAHDLADEWIDADEEHQGTEFTFVLVAPEIPDDVREMVGSFTERQLIKFGYYGHYEVHFVVVAPDVEACVASPNTDVDRAFALWRDPGAPESRGGLLARLARALRR